MRCSRYGGCINTETIMDKTLTFAQRLALHRGALAEQETRVYDARINGDRR